MATEPGLARFLVPVFDTAAGAGNFVRAHAGVANDNNFVVRAVSVEHIPGRQLFTVPTPVVLPDTFVNAVVEVEML